MKCCVVLCLLVCLANSLPTDFYRTEWEKFKKTYGKLYSTPDEENLRFHIFSDKLDEITAHNRLYEKGLSSYKMGLNKFSDYTQEEYQKMLGVLPKNSGLQLDRIEDEEYYKKQWQIFKKSYGKMYSSTEENLGYGIFCRNLAAIEKHNEDYRKGLTTFKMGINQFSDMTEEEMKNYMGVLPYKVSSFMESIDESCKKQYIEYKKSYGKVYDSEEDEVKHLEIFCQNIKGIKEHNEMFKRGETTFEMGVNRFTDMTEDEIKKYLGFINEHDNFGSFIESENPEENCKEHYEEYKKAFGKVYKPQDENLHLEIFCKNLIAIEEHNNDYDNGETFYEMGLNIFTDMTPEEIKQHMGLVDHHTDKHVGSTYLPADVYETEWQKFKVTFKKTYPTQEEESHRFQVFCENLDDIYKHNELYDKGQVSFKMGVNKLTDMTHEEYLEYLHDGRL